MISSENYGKSFDSFLRGDFPVIHCSKGTCQDGRCSAMVSKRGNRANLVQHGYGLLVGSVALLSSRLSILEAAGGCGHSLYVSRTGGAHSNFGPVISATIW